MRAACRLHWLHVAPAPAPAALTRSTATARSHRPATGMGWPAHPSLPPPKVLGILEQFTHHLLVLLLQPAGGEN